VQNDFGEPISTLCCLKAYNEVLETALRPVGQTKAQTLDKADKTFKRDEELRKFVNQIAP